MPTQSSRLARWGEFNEVELVTIQSALAASSHGLEAACRETRDLESRRGIVAGFLAAGHMVFDIDEVRGNPHPPHAVLNEMAKAMLIGDMPPAADFPAAA